MSEAVYTVVDTGHGVMKVIDIMSGMQAGVISPRGKVVTPPVISGNHVSFVVELQNGDRMGTTHKLPAGSLISQFRA